MFHLVVVFVFFFNDTAPTEIYTLSLHDALPICYCVLPQPASLAIPPSSHGKLGDRKSTRLNSSHRCISYAVFCLKKKKKHVGFAAILETTPFIVTFTRCVRT